MGINDGSVAPDCAQGGACKPTMPRFLIGWTSWQGPGGAEVRGVRVCAPPHAESGHVWPL